MARRGGKAATRRSRQRRAQRQPGTQATQPATQARDEAPAPEVTPSTDAFEKADAELRASTPPPGSRAESSPRANRAPRPRPDYVGASGPSRLSERAVAEYHYVARDLRNIAVLVVVLAALLAASAFVVNMLGVGTSA